MVTSAARLHAFQEVFKKLCKQPGDGQPGDYVLKLVGMQALTCDRGDSCDACKNIELPEKIDLIMPSGSSQPIAKDPVLKLHDPEKKQDLYSIDLIKLVESWESIQESEAVSPNTEPPHTQAPEANEKEAEQAAKNLGTAAESHADAKDKNKKHEKDTQSNADGTQADARTSADETQADAAESSPNITTTIEIQGLNDCSMILRFKQAIELVPGSDSVCPNAKLCRKLHITLDGSVALSGSPGETDTSFKDKDDLLKWASVNYASKMEGIIKYANKSRRCSACDMK